MREICKSGSVGARGGQPPWATRREGSRHSLGRSLKEIFSVVYANGKGQSLCLEYVFHQSQAKDDIGR